MMMSLTSMEGFFLGNWLAQQSSWKRLSVVRKVKKLIGTGELSAHAERHFALRDYEAAFAFVRSGGGKALFRMGGA
jgi:hypothetical protein